MVRHALVHLLCTCLPGCLPGCPCTCCAPAVHSHRRCRRCALWLACWLAHGHLFCHLFCRLLGHLLCGPRRQLTLALLCAALHCAVPLCAALHCSAPANTRTLADASRLGRCFLLWTTHTHTHAHTHSHTMLLFSCATKRRLSHHRLPVVLPCRGSRFPSNYVSKPTLLQPSINVNVQQYDLSAPVQQEYSPAPSSSTNASSQQRLRISTHSHRSADSSNISSPGGFVPHPRNARSPTPTGQRTDLPPNWGSKTAPDGRIYYYNLVTDETRWTLPVFDPRASDQQQDQQQRQGQEDASASIATALAQLNLDAPPEWTWPGLSARIFSCVEALAQATSSSRKERYVPLASAIIDSIRTMLYATDTAKKDSPAIVANKVLRSYHRQILSALSKLVLAAKTASAVWPPPDAMHVLNQIAGDVLLGVRNFSTTAQELGLPVHAIAISGSGQQPQPQDATASAPVSAPAKVASIAGDAAHDHDGQHTNTELLAFLEGSTNRTIELMKTIADPARLLAFQDNGKPASAATGPVDVAKQQMTLISAVRSIVQEVGNFLESVDDLPLDSLSDDITVDFKVNRLALYNSISSLVMSTQLATNAVTASNAHREIVTAARLVENAIKDLLIATKFLIEEKETMEQVTLQTYIEQYGNNGQGGNRPPSGDMQGRQRNAMSMGAYQSSVPGPNSAAAVSIPGGRAGNNSSPTPEMAYSPGQTGDWDDEAFNISKRSSKLRQILGQEVAPIIRAKPDTPWYMQYDYGPNDIILNMEVA
ncbi:hypothetical protein BC831DRAFT_306226 [Entophlyctis helioformis]|nr:hypothetical protein BC831DRAFT_306226 [Entophlyctis helioformis]